MAGDEEEETPLMLQQQQHTSSPLTYKIQPTGNIWTGLAHFIAGVIGSGVLSLAWSIAQLGWIAGPLTIILVAFFSLVSAFLVTNIHTYSHPLTNISTTNPSFLPAVHTILEMWKLHHDPTIWSNPCELRPERLLTDYHKNLDVIRGTVSYSLLVQEEGLVLGLAELGVKMLQIVLATLLQNFEISTPNNAPVDMTESPRITNAKAIPLEVLISLRRFHP